MRLLREWLCRLAATLSRRRLDHDLEEELRSHLELAADEATRRGRPAADAAREARVRAGALSSAMDAVRDQRGLPRLDDLSRDLRHGLRALGHSPAFTAAALVTLALGIGANTAIFTVVNAVLLRPLPYRAADRLVQVFEVSRVFGRSEATETTFRAWLDRGRTLEAAAVFTRTTLTFVGDGHAEELAGARVLPAFFDVLGVDAYRGRLFKLGEGRPGGHDVVVLSYGAWQRLFGARDDVIGRSVRLGDRTPLVIGVLPPGFRFAPLDRRESGNLTRATEFWLPLALTQTGPNASGMYYLGTLGRLAPGATAEQARAELDAIARQATGGASSADVAPLQAEIVHAARGTLLLLFGAVGFVLAIACANVAHLQLARGLARGRELAIRVAIGASRGRLVRQLLVEALVVAAAGGLLGLAAAFSCLGVLVRLAGADLPRADAVAIDARVIGFTAVVAGLAAVGFGLLPAVQASAVDPNRQLKEGGRTRAPGRSGTKLTRLLVGGEGGLALVLTVCAGLMLASVWQAERAPLGFRADRLLSMRITLSGQRYRGDAGARFCSDLLESLARLPGVEIAAAANTLPMGGATPFQGFVVEGTGGPGAPAQDRIRGQYRTVTPEYFRALAIPLRSGRPFTDADRDGARLVAIVNETAERRHFGGHAVGRRFFSGRGDDPIEVVGVVGDIRHEYARSEPLPEVYYPLAQAPTRYLWLVVRTAGEPGPLAPAVSQAIAARDPDIPIDHVQTMEDRRAASLGVSTFLAVLLVTFAGLALLLVVFGVYGVVSYSVSRRMHEIGVRLALGATRSAVATMVLGETLAVVGAALLVGAPVAVACARLLASYLFEVEPTDLRTVAAAGGLILLAALSATLTPAWRAARLDPLAALREE